MDPVRWLVQLPPPGDDSPTHAQLQRACEALSLPFDSIEVVARVPPRFPPLDGPTCVHGRMTLLRAACSDPVYRRTVFFEPARFTVEASVQAWGARMLNSEAAIRTWEDVMTSLPSHSVFVRPNNDDKAFTGAVFSPQELRALYDRLTARNLVQPSDLVAISQAREVDAEARVFIAEGKAIGGSYYRPDASPRLPAELIDFAQEAARVWSPAPVFVLDVGRVSGAYRIVETNCMNGCRFYGADVLAVVGAISSYQAARWSAGSD